jgi:hypothetical protein
MPASRITASKPERLPVGFGPINPQAPWDSKRFFTALAATGNAPYVFYAIDDDRVRIERNICVPKTKLQKRRFANLLAWERNMDPKRQQQFGYVSALVRSMTFAASADGSPRFFYYPIA